MKYGVPHYDHEGRITGVAFDHDGDGVYDDYEPVVSEPIVSGDDYFVIGSDHDGDGVFDDTTFVVSANREAMERTSSPGRQTYYHHAKPIANSSGGKSFFSTKEKLKIVGIIFLALVAFGIISNLVIGSIGILYFIFHFLFA